MRTFPMPLNATLEQVSTLADLMHEAPCTGTVLNYEVGRIIQDYGDAGYPLIDVEGPFVKRLEAEGFTTEQAMLHLFEAWEIDNKENL